MHHLPSAKDAISRCRAFRDTARTEAVLRAEFQSRLRSIFPSADDEVWLNHYSAGAEARTTLAGAGGATLNRFIDNLVGSTTIEYEADLRIPSKFEEGFGQVREHAAGLVSSGLQPAQIRGILSDTVDWFAYDIELAPDIDPLACGPQHITLKLIDELHLLDSTDQSAERLVQFVRKHLAREKSRRLSADLIALDLGLDQPTFRRCEDDLLRIVEDGRVASPSIALATELWSRFVDHLERSTPGAFRSSAYVDEIYVCMLARLLSANALNGSALLSDDNEIGAILSGTFFSDHYGLSNMVEQDYFGWLTTPAFLAHLVPIGHLIQRDLYAYDFSLIADEDLFGRLLTQLARRSHRQLLGQEWTPRWLARLLAERCLSDLGEGAQPRIIDMCCGSGSMLAEVIKSIRDRNPAVPFEVLSQAATGFDIDPLAVTLSKTTWVVTLAPQIKAATSAVVVPVFHADSLFAVTPVSSMTTGEDGQPINIHLDGATVELPSEIVQPEFRAVFDRFVDWSYDEAMDARTRGSAAHITPDLARIFLQATLAAAHITPNQPLFDRIVSGVHAVAYRMAELAIADRNGIWAFILKNTYRPGLLSGQFNGLVSNPPWLAMSALGENPYREHLSARARQYGIKPGGASHLHLELATTHLLHAIDRYLAPNAAVACVIPGPVFNGDHYEKFRQRQYLSSDRPVPFELSQVWQVARGTFKYPGAVVIGSKKANVAAVSTVPPHGFLAAESGLSSAALQVLSLGQRRTAWVLEYEGAPIGLASEGNLPLQGADLMPRSAVCIEVLQDGVAEFRVKTPQSGDPHYFATKDGKQFKGENFPGRVAPAFIYRMAQSVNLLPYTLGSHFATIAIPAQRRADGTWNVLDEAAIRAQGFAETARRFGRINTKLADIGRGQTLQERIDERNKLSQQVFSPEGFLVLGGAGGKDVCAACVPVAGNEDLIIDQTLYWKVVSENEAWFMVGLLNSKAITEAVRPFNPKGEFGERHLHTLPYRLLPPFDPGNEVHGRIVELARLMASVVVELAAANNAIGDPTKTIQSRRLKARAALHERAEFIELEETCARILGTGPTGDAD